jgi:type IV secretion system protein VirB1
MDAAAFLTLSLACAPLVDPVTSSAIVATESAAHPYAIGVVGGALQRQPRNLPEAVATAKALAASGRNFSVGLAQINVHNLARLRLSIEDAFDECANLRAMQSVLLDCHQRTRSRADAQAALRRVLSCYYSGNETTGFAHGYVQRVVSASLAGPRAPP